MNLRIDDKGKYFTPRVSKESVTSVVRTTDHLIVGNIYIRPDQRLKDELNQDPDRFLAITDAHVYDTTGKKLLFESEFLLIAYDHIVLVSPREAINNVMDTTWLQTKSEEDV